MDLKSVAIRRLSATSSLFETMITLLSSEWNIDLASENLGSGRDEQVANGELGENQIYSFATADLNAKCCPEVVTQIQDMRFFDTLIGKIDRNAGNFMVVTPNKETADLRDPTTRIIGIDHGNVFGPPSPEGLRIKAKEYNISNERITEISNGLDKLSNIQGLDAGTLGLTNSLLRNLKEAFPHLNK